MAEPNEHPAAAHNPFAPHTLFEHVQDAYEFQVPKFLAPPDGIVKIPQPFVGDVTEENIHGFRITKFMLIELVVAIVIAAIFIRLARKMQRGDAPKGRLWNLFEGILVY